MTLLVLIACLLAQHFYKGTTAGMLQVWLEAYLTRITHYTQRLDDNLRCAWIIIALRLAPGMLAIACLYWLLLIPALGLLAFCFSIAVLFFAMKPPITAQRFQAYDQALAQQAFDSAASEAEVVFGHPFEPTGDALHMAVRQATLRYMYHDVFTVIFWYMLLGPAGALLPALLTAYASQLSHDAGPRAEQLKQHTAQLIHWLGWPVVRLMGVALAVIGHFPKASQYWLQNLKSDTPNETFLSTISTEADPEQNTHTKPHLHLAHMLTHALAVWVICIAVFRVGGWLL